LGDRDVYEQLIRGLVTCLLLAAEASQRLMAAHLLLLIPLALALDVWVIRDLWPLFLYCSVFWAVGPVAVRLLGYDFESVDDARRLGCDHPALHLPGWLIPLGTRHTDVGMLGLRFVLLSIIALS